MGFLKSVQKKKKKMLRSTLISQLFKKIPQFVNLCAAYLVSGATRLAAMDYLLFHVL